MTNDVLFEMVLSESYSPLKLDKRVLKAGIRSAVLQFQCVPVLCGSALKNKGIQPLLDSVVDYLPSPHDMALAVLVNACLFKKLIVTDEIIVSFPSYSTYTFMYVFTYFI